MTRNEIIEDLKTAEEDLLTVIYYLEGNGPNNGTVTEEVGCFSYLGIEIKNTLDELFSKYGDEPIKK